ncbi:MAG TPA: hypothetical protein DEO83_02510, partial [Lachnospiraceae bacterium]|nr:hypothetical protein [Lachnospiraceae bacterium]
IGKNPLPLAINPSLPPKYKSIDTFYWQLQPTPLFTFSIFLITIISENNKKHTVSDNSRCGGAK